MAENLPVIVMFDHHSRPTDYTFLVQHVFDGPLCYPRGC